MNIQKGVSREQLWMISLETEISPDNVVRLIDVFVNQLDLNQLGFTKTKVKKEGRPLYQASDILKIYYYGYLNRIRSSRRLAAECCRNVELWWLLHHLKAGYHTIADFRKENPEALTNAFKMFVCFLKQEGLLGGELAATDGTKVRAQNNKKNNFNEAKFKKRLEYIETRTEEYIRELDTCDTEEDKNDAEVKRKDVTKKLNDLKEREKHYKELQDTLLKSGEKQLSLADPDSRSLPLKDRVTDVCYNVEAAADSNHSLIVAFDTTNTSDQGQLCPMSL